jgi:hypothetical protein
MDFNAFIAAFLCHIELMLQSMTGRDTTQGHGSDCQPVSLFAFANRSKLVARDYS